MVRRLPLTKKVVGVVFGRFRCASTMFDSRDKIGQEFISEIERK